MSIKKRGFVMKKIALCFSVFAAISLIGPVAFLKPDNKAVIPQKSETVIRKSEGDNSFRVKLADGKTVVVSSKDYIVGCLAGEMPVEFEKEALKAQGVAAYTFALYKKSISDNDFDITADYTVDQCYLTVDEQKSKWGEDFEKNREYFEEIARSVEGEWLSFENKPALSVYHSVSSGATYSAKEVWGEDIPYLRPVDSSSDKLDKNYKNTVELSVPDFNALVGSEDKNKTPSIEVKHSESGRVYKVVVNSKAQSVDEFVKKTGLVSINFECQIKDNKVLLISYGKGHGVGMSQCGANAMAKSGSTYKEILHHYYSGCSIKKN